MRPLLILIEIVIIMIVMMIELGDLFVQNSLDLLQLLIDLMRGLTVKIAAIVNRIDRRSVAHHTGRTSRPSGRSRRQRVAAVVDYVMMMVMMFMRITRVISRVIRGHGIKNAFLVIIRPPDILD